MDLSNLKPADGATQSKQRLGRGEGSGRGGHSSTRGTKGQSSRSGAGTRPIWFEGGQTPLFQRVPKHGFSNAPFRTEYDVANVQRLQRLVDEGRLSAGDSVTPAVLADLGLVQNEDCVKILGDGSISTPLDVSAHAFSASAQQKIEAAGGTATALDD